MDCALCKKNVHLKEGVIILHQDEKELLKEICIRYGLDLSYFNTLFQIEKSYADRNMSRRKGIYHDLEQAIENWVSNGSTR